MEWRSRSQRAIQIKQTNKLGVHLWGDVLTGERPFLDAVLFPTYSKILSNFLKSISTSFGIPEYLPNKYWSLMLFLSPILLL